MILKDNQNLQTAKNRDKLEKTLSQLVQLKSKFNSVHSTSHRELKNVVCPFIILIVTIIRSLLCIGHISIFQVPSPLAAI